MQRKQESVIFAVPGRRKAAVAAFGDLLTRQGGDPNHVVEVVCDMSAAYLVGIAETLSKAEVTVDKVLQKVPTPRAARWRTTDYLRIMRKALVDQPLLKPMGKALATLERHA